jgi:hypothetical protein
VDQYTTWHCNKKVLIWEGEHSFLVCLLVGENTGVALSQ